MKLAKHNHKNKTTTLFLSLLFVFSVVLAGNYHTVLAQHPEGSYGAGGYGSDVYGGSVQEDPEPEPDPIETISFCVYTGENCAGGTSVVDFGTLNMASTTTESSSFDVATNASGGVTVAAFGTTLDSGSNTIDAFGLTPAESAPGSEQFGFRVISVTGGNLAALAPFNNMNSNQYMFEPDTYIDVAGSSGPTNSSTVEIEYAVNISAITPLGIYISDINYIATATF